jgi:hypothetical protein
MSVREVILHQDVEFSADGKFTSRSLKKHSVAVYLVQYKTWILIYIFMKFIIFNIIFEDILFFIKKNELEF